jgi:small subunit ribosomal protein S16
MLKIRLQRTGKRGQAYFRVVVLEHTTKPKGKYLEFLGSYDPHKNEISVKADRVKYWLSMGAQLSETANNLLVGKGVIEGEKVKVWKPKKKKEKETAKVKAAPVAASAEKPQTEEAPAPKEKEEESEPAKAEEEVAQAPAEEAGNKEEAAPVAPQPVN